MTETIPDDLRDLHPSEIRMNVIILLLAPMFLAASGGCIDLARIAALDTINAYRMGNNPDLIAIGQLVACGLASLGSLGQSMANDVSVSMALRLRSNANTLNRSTEQNRRTIREAQNAPPLEFEDTQSEEARFAQAQHEAAMEASLSDIQKRLAETQQRLAEAPLRPNPAAPPAAPLSSPAATSSSGLLSRTPEQQQLALLNRTREQQQQDASWAAGMAEVAAEYVASLPSLPPAERKQASMRAAVLSSTANALLLAAVPSGALIPGSLSAILRPNLT